MEFQGTFHTWYNWKLLGKEVIHESKCLFQDKIEDIFDASLIDESIKNTKAFNTFINNYYELLN